MFPFVLTLIEQHLGEPVGEGADRPFRGVLAIEGAGVRTLSALSVLKALEGRLAKLSPGSVLEDHFDFFGGNSFGGAIAALLAQGRLVEDAEATLIQAIRPVLRRRWFNVPFRARYDQNRLVAALEEAFADTKLSDVPKLVVSTFDLASCQHLLWCGHPDFPSPNPGASVARVTSASIAAPLYFDPVRVSANGASQALVDGALWAADPARVTLQAARKALTPTPLLPEMVLLSVGVGRASNPDFGKGRPGLQKWATALPRVLMNANRDFTHEHLVRLFQEAGVLNHYFRFDPTIPEDSN